MQFPEEIIAQKQEKQKPFMRSGFFVFKSNLDRKKENEQRKTGFTSNQTEY